MDPTTNLSDLQVIPLNCPVAEPAQVDPELENSFICHLQDHWFSIRKVNGEWYNFNSLYAAPDHLSQLTLTSIFHVRGSFPKDCSISTSEARGFGKWIMPEDAQRITKSCNTSQSGTHTTRAPTQPIASFYQTFREERSLSDMENDDFMGLPCLCTWRFQHLFNSYAVRELPECGSGNIWNHNVLLRYVYSQFSSLFNRLLFCFRFRIRNRKIGFDSEKLFSSTSTIRLGLGSI
ncbi:hypothetical protein MKX03_009011 [Papaver bracteatum]|nr:hypothetical protein MKX03_009011 [Papaver bracteatum]